MARIWCLFCHRGENGDSHLYHPEVFYLYVVYDFWFTSDYLCIHRFLDECEKVYFECEEESLEVLVNEKVKSQKG